MSASHQVLFDQLCDHARETALLSTVESVLGWDERTHLPPAGGPYRAEQMSLLAGMIHQRATDPRVGAWLEQLADGPLAADPHSDAGTVIRQLKRNYDKQVKLPQSLVEELTRTAIEGQRTWERARAENDFASFRPVLEKTLHLKRQQAEALGYAECRYDALLDDFEPDELTSNVRGVLSALRDELVPLIRQIAESSRQPDIELLRRDYPVDAQAEFGRRVAEQVGFDFQRGRLDVTTHPFCTGLGPHDTRILTRYEPRFFPSGFYSILHEAGHGLYDQGLRAEWFGLPPGRAVSLGIHESQSRLWENFVGRSREFWQCQFPAAQQAFPASLTDATADDFYAAVNAVEPSLIRVEADEATYNLHILIRFELEQELLDERLPVDELPAAWNSRYREYLGVEPPSDTDGVLQDIHWSGGAIGYFPTYSLGNLYAAQFYAQADTDLGGLSSQLAAGQFEPLRQWLCEKIHAKGQCHTAAELVQHVTGRPLSHDFLIQHLRSKLGPLYGIA